MALIAPGGDDARLKLSELARDAVRLSVDGEAVPPVVDEVSIEDGAARVRLSFAIAQSRSQARRLTITSDVPKRVARGHRELLVVSRGRSRGGREAARRGVRSGGDRPRRRSPSAARAAWQFLELGVRHILSGYDHLVFLAGLLLAARTVRELVVALTAFTAAHSVSLALVVIGGIHAPASIVEPLIAASIAWVGLENLPARAARRPLAGGVRVRADSRVRIRGGADGARVRIFGRRDRAGAVLVQRRCRSRPACGGGGHAAAASG